MLRHIKYFLIKNKFKVLVLLVVLLGYACCLPNELFESPTSTILESRDGELLGALIANDGQWRFPKLDSVPNKFKQCITTFEDAYFYKHPGFNPVSMVKAFQANLKAGKVVRGGSTITQQVIRLSRKNQSRSYFEKVIEIILATRLELRDSKETILNTYVSNAPYGGNVVGLEAASWRYFKTSPHKLSWGQCALLAVLPNAPSLLYPGKNSKQLINKRNALLKKLFDTGVIDQTTYELSTEEPVPTKPQMLPQIAPHLLQKIAMTQKGERVISTINTHFQELALQIVNRHHKQHAQNGIHNMAVLILDVKSKKVLSYIGNTNTKKQHQKDVDIILAPRSTGSVLKPFLYMAMLDAGELLPETLLADVPTTIGNYKPENFSLNYLGAVSAKEALARSLNIPAVRMLQDFGLTRFYDVLQKLELSHINKGADHYGLSVILGGSESSLWDICNAYCNLAGTLNHFNENSSQYYTNEFQKAGFSSDFQPNLGALNFDKDVFNAGSIYFGFEAMKELNRPSADNSWRHFESAQEIAWKTGTSFGNRDAWSVGVTSNYVVGVWVGNADGEGRSGMTGVATAAPVMFDVFDALPKSAWFLKPIDDLVEAKVCDKSGQLASDICPYTIKQIPLKGLDSGLCMYHKLVYLNKDRTYRVNASCERLDDMVKTSQFVLPPLMAWYYKTNHDDYKYLPPLKAGCEGEETPVMAFTEPLNTNTIIVPKGISGERNKIIFKIAHTNPEAQIYWYLDNQFLKVTQNFNELAIHLTSGYHTVTALDEKGNSIAKRIIVK
ncbi:penicillin-binding protein 1C [Tamlana sp. s12]|nr:penicillin-binding protein 1C [Tamlana sp. s12]OBQ56439.1 penicillin-binding protein [Tamlana sp. s12]QQY81936.1 penicillin-binding protein 1C [Tamlana sp. s12]